jgi:hypothetical protein
MIVFQKSIFSSGMRAIFITALLMMAGCARTPVDQVDLMPAPDVYGDGLLNLLPENDPIVNIPYKGILYATDRRPAVKNDSEQYYANDRGQLVRLGVARVTMGKKEFSWDFARDVSMLKARSTKFPVKISSIEEWGLLGSTVPYWANINLCFQMALHLTRQSGLPAQ